MRTLWCLVLCSKTQRNWTLLAFEHSKKKKSRIGGSDDITKDKCIHQIQDAINELNGKKRQKMLYWQKKRKSFSRYLIFIRINKENKTLLDQKFCFYHIHSNKYMYIYLLKHTQIYSYACIYVYKWTCL